MIPGPLQSVHDAPGPGGGVFDRFLQSIVVAVKKEREAAYFSASMCQSGPAAVCWGVHAAAS